MPRPSRNNVSCSLPRRALSASPRSEPSRPSSRPAGTAAAAWRADHHVAEIRAEAVGAAQQLAIVQYAEPEAVLDADHQKIVETARLPEPVFGESDEVDVAVDRDRDAEPPRQFGAEIHVALAEDRALPADGRSPYDDAGQADADAGDFLHRQPGVAHALTHAVFDEIGDDQGRAGDQRECCSEGLAGDVGAEVGGRDGDLVRRELDADDEGGVRIEPEHDAGAAAAGVAHLAHLPAG